MPPTRPRRRASLAPWLPLPLLPLALAGCGWLLGTPVLHVTPSLLPLSSRTLDDGAPLWIANTGPRGSQLMFRITASDPRVQPSPASGTLAGGTRQGVDIRIDDAGLAMGEGFAANLTIDSNAGQRTVPLSFLRTVGGLESCGTFPLESPAPAAPSTARPAATAPARGFVPGQILVGYAARVGGQAARGAPGAAQRLAEEVRRAYGLRRLGSVGGGVELLSAADADAALARLRADPRVRYAERNAFVELQLAPDDPHYASDQWNLRDFGLEAAWEVETGGSNEVVVAVIDSGVERRHPDLVAKVLPGCDFYGNDNDPGPGAHVTADSGHGTHVAGIAAATGNDAHGVTGVAFGPRVRILPVKIFDDTGTRATVAQLARAIRWSAGLAVDGVATNPHPADIINMSLGTPGTSVTLDDAAAEAWAAGALLIAAAGNHGPNQNAAVMSPANGPRVVGVGSVDADGGLSSFSNVGPEVDLVAPGGAGPSACGYVLSTTPFGAYGCEAGTSMAAPFVAGAAALLLSQAPGSTNQQLLDRLLATARPGGGTADEVGHGLACADLALGAPTRCGEAP